MATINRKFKAGQLFELTKLLHELYSLEPFELRPYLKQRIADLEDEKEIPTSPHSPRRRVPEDKSGKDGKTWLDDDED